jgi:hypothetical protein
MVASEFWDEWQGEPDGQESEIGRAYNEMRLSWDYKQRKTRLRGE